MMRPLLRYHLPYGLIVALLWAVVFFGLPEMGPDGMSEPAVRSAQWGMSAAAVLAVLGYISLVTTIGLSYRCFAAAFFGGIVVRLLLLAVAAVGLTGSVLLDYTITLLVGVGGYLLLSIIELFFLVPQGSALNPGRSASA